MLQPITSIADLDDAIMPWLETGDYIGLVPTMGALHAGHISLITHAKKQCQRVIVSIFVNPKQFGKGEDFDEYPRTLTKDIALLENAGVDMVYAPTSEAMYPKGFCTSIHMTGITDRLCGAARPGHFDGVATVVIKLLQQVIPTHVFFGKKDYQQLQIIKQLCQDLDYKTWIVGCPTYREDDGLALSSRNHYLSAKERKIAPALYNTLRKVADDIRNENAIDNVLPHGKEALLAAGFSSIDYLEYCDAETLIPLSAYTKNQPTRLLVAAFLGTTRLIDNIEV